MNRRIAWGLAGIAVAGGIFALSPAKRPVCAIPQEFISGSSKVTPVVEAVERAMPSIVDIHAEAGAVLQGQPVLTTRPGTNEIYVIHPLRGVKSTRSGAGIIVDSGGIILTNEHVIESLPKVTVTTADGRSFDAKVLGVETRYDLAVLKIKSDKLLPAVRFSDAGKLRVGEPVIAVGNPFGLGKSVSAGVLSAKNRDIVWNERNRVYENLIQTDISLNVGNSGGPLLNVDGDLIGINLAVPVGSQGISFAIPSNVVKLAYEDFLKKNPQQKNDIKK